MELRKPTKDEEKLIEFLIKESGTTVPGNWKDNLLVTPMDDGGTGSLCLYPTGVAKTDLDFGACAGGIEFKDVDGVEVVISLNLDTKGDLFELDVWKADFSSLVKFPEL